MLEESPAFTVTPAGDTAEGWPGVPLDWLYQEEHCSISGSWLYPAGDTGEVGPRVPLDWLRMFHQRFSAVSLPERRPRLDWSFAGWIGYHLRKNTVPSAVLGCTLPETRGRVDSPWPLYGDTGSADTLETRPRSDLESRWIGYHRKNTVLSAVLGCTLPETRGRVDFESRWIGNPLEEHCSINGSRLYPARDTAEGGPGVLLD